MTITARRIAGLIALVSLLAGPALAAKVGQPAPSFKVTTFDHKVVSLDDLRGKVVVLNFWATWCAPCRREMVVMDSYIREHPGSDLRVFAISTEDSVPDAQLVPLAKALAFPLVIRLHGWGYGVINNALPTSYVIDRSGILRHAEPGAFDAQSFDALITPLLAEPAPEPKIAPLPTAAPTSPPSLAHAAAPTS